MEIKKAVENTPIIKQKKSNDEPIRKES